jgi:hypothetical protein
MEDNKAPNNIIQFPTKRKETEQPGADKPPTQPSAQKPAKKKRSNKKNVSGTVLAIMLATGAVNRIAFNSSWIESQDLASNSGTGTGRGIASVSEGSFQRDADWEKQLAESLASTAQTREVASVQVGRAATPEEKLRWGTLEEKYTITYRSDVHQIQSILLQDSTSTPAYVLNRSKFLQEYGTLMSGDFANSRLKSVETVNEKTVESYTLFDKDQHARGEARFELDRHKRLLSLKVEPAKI